jgi:hypothetical protein
MRERNKQSGRVVRAMSGTSARVRTAWVPGRARARARSSAEEEEEELALNKAGSACYTEELALNERPHPYQ